MNRKKLYLTLICTLLLTTSCNQQSRMADRILKKAEALVEQYPDSALILLDSIQNPQNLEKRQRYQYLLLQVQAKDKSDQDIASDTLIFKVKNYYLKAGDLNKAALSSLYSGRVLQAQKKYEKSMTAYLDAENYSKQIKNDNLNGLIQSSIGKVYYDQLLKDEAIPRFKLASKYFHQSENYRNEIVTFNQIGNCFLLQCKNDSAFVYFSKGLALADQYRLVNEQINIRQSIGVAYRQTGDFYRAKIFFKQALTFSVDSMELARLYCNLAKVFEEEDQTDSARYYLERSLDRLPEGKSSYLAANIYKTWSSIEAKDENYRGALEHHKWYSKYLASILDENKNKAVLEIQRKYDLQLLQNKNEKLQIQRQRILLFALFLLLFIYVLFFFFYKRSMQNEKELLEVEQKIYQLKELSRSFDEKENSFRNILLKHFGILTKTTLLEGYLSDEEKRKEQHLLKKFNEIVYGQGNLDWGILYRLMDELYDGFLDKLIKRFPQLDETELQICCLSCAKFNNTEIAIMMKYHVSTIHMKKSVIRKKIGIKNFANIQNFLNEKVKN
jgi:tetratricopeptide (TPR) repeat protein